MLLSASLHMWNGIRVRAAYHRSEYLEERRKMMDWWGACIESMAKDQKVVFLQRKPG